MIDSFSGFSVNAKNELIEYLTDYLPEIEVRDPTADDEYTLDGTDYKVCIVRINTWKDPQHVSIKGNVAIELVYSTASEIEEDSATIRELLMYDYVNGERISKVFTSKEYNGVKYIFWMDFSNDYDTQYYPEVKEYRRIQTFEFIATIVHV